MISTSLSALVLLVCFSRVANAWFRLPCTDPLVTERLDPVVSPGISPSQHVHTVHGARNFAPSNTYDSLRASNCTSCQVSQDKSNYWFPSLYFHDPSTHKFELVPNGGVLVYYQNRGSQDVANGGPGLKAFPPGFRVVSGNPALRSKKLQDGLGTQAELAERAIGYACLRYTTPNPGYSGFGFPTTDCEAGFQSRVHLPACWDGVNADSADHKSHVAFLSSLDNGNCPSTHPVGLMKLFYEVTWDVHSFASRWNPANGWPFVYSTGDPTGYSFHADFQTGWDNTALQNAIDKCNNPNDDTGAGVVTACPFFNFIDGAVAKTCKTPSIVSEPVSGTLTKLPGCNPIQNGPGDATIFTDANCPS